MPNKSKPSTWQPSDLHILNNFDALYPEDVRQTIAEAVPDNISAEDRRALVNAAIVIAAGLYVAQKHAGRATVPEIRAGISNIQLTANLLEKALTTLDHDSRTQLHNASDPDGPDGDIALAETSR